MAAGQDPLGSHSTLVWWHSSQGFPLPAPGRLWEDAPAFLKFPRLTDLKLTWLFIERDVDLEYHSGDNVIKEQPSDPMSELQLFLPTATNC